MAKKETRSDTSAPLQKRAPALNPLHEAAMRLAGMGLGRPKEKTRDLVNLLLCHGARAWRQTQPEANIHLHLGSKSGRAPVFMRIR